MNANSPHGAIDHTIDRALSALRDAQPRSGLEGRILTSLEHRSASPQSTRFHISAHLALWAATSAAILAIASLIILHHHATPTEFARVPQSTPSRPENTVILSEQSESKNPDAARRTTNAEPISTTNLARTDAHGTQARGLGAGFSPLNNGAQTNGASAPADLDAQALADLHAPSHPAPPLPLTPQEKLFLRMVRYANATELAELDPLVRAKRDDDETADFKAFFPDPPPLKQPGDTE